MHKKGQKASKTKSESRVTGSGMFIPDTGSDFFPSRIPDPNFSIPDAGSTPQKNSSILDQKIDF